MNEQLGCLYIATNVIEINVKKRDLLANNRKLISTQRPCLDIQALF